MSVTVQSIGLLAAALTTFSFLPQAILTLRTRKTDEISLAMYLMFSSGVVFWLAYGLAIGDLAVSLANGVTLLFALPILVVKLINRVKGIE